mgnify:CR=1 FL=1
MRKIKVKMLKEFLKVNHINITNGTIRRVKRMYNGIPRPYRNKDKFVAKLVKTIVAEC